MNRRDPRVGSAVLQILADAGRALGASRVARELSLQGFDLQTRMVRYHLGRLDAEGWTENLGRAGRRLTAKGLEELHRTGSDPRTELASAHMDNMAFRMDLDPLLKRGRIVLNISRLTLDALRASATLLRETLISPHGLPQRVGYAHEGETLGGTTAPYGVCLLGTVCNVTLNGALRAAGIPVTARFAGLLDMANGQPQRFSHMIHYDGSTLDPGPLFLRARMTRVREALRGGRGNLLAGFREIPAVALPQAERIIGLLERMGLGRPLAVGRPGRPLLGIPVAPGRVGLALPAGLNAVAILEESGVVMDHQAAAVLHPVEELLRPSELDRRVAATRRLHQRLAALMENPPADREYAHTE